MRKTFGEPLMDIGGQLLADVIWTCVDTAGAAPIAFEAIRVTM